MDLNLNPEFASALAAERRGRFLAEAAHAHRLDEITQGQGLRMTLTRIVTSLLVRAVTGTARSGERGETTAAPSGIDRWGLGKEVWRAA
jgi:hypothetical protein